MKKIICLAAAFLLVVTLFTACKKEPSVSETEPNILQDSIFDTTPVETQAQSSPTEAVPVEPTQEATQPTAAPAPGQDDVNPAEDGEVTKPTAPAVQDATEPSHPEDEDTPQPSTKPTEEPSQPSTAPTEEDKPMDYQTFHAMSGAEQQAFQQSFESLDEFFEWYNDAKEAYEKANPPIEVGGDGVIDMEDLVGGNG